MNQLVKDAYLFFLTDSNNISRKGIEILILVAFGECDLAECFKDDKYIEKFKPAIKYKRPTISSIEGGWKIV